MSPPNLPNLPNLPGPPPHGPRPSPFPEGRPLSPEESLNADLAPLLAEAVTQGPAGPRWAPTVVVLALQAGRDGLTAEGLRRSAAALQQGDAADLGAESAAPTPVLSAISSCAHEHCAQPLRRRWLEQMLRTAADVLLAGAG